jgi:hypothetical protein
VPDPALLSEDQLKRFLESHLVERGWTVTVAWGKHRGVDLLARGRAERLIVKCKGEAPTLQMEGNYFLSALGELVQRMHEPDVGYALALSENARFCGLAERLPPVARARLTLAVFFVQGDGSVSFDPPPSLEAVSGVAVSG